MKKYRFILLVLLLFLTGCDVDYKINIDEKLNVKEEITFENDNIEDYADPMGYSSSQDLFDDLYGQAAEKAIKDGYSISNESTTDNTKVVFKKDSTLMLLSNSELKSIYPYLDATCNEEKCSIIGTSDKITSEGDGIFPKYKIQITLPYKVFKQNADEIDLKSNTYIWYYSLDGKRSDIELVFEKQGKNIIEVNKKNTFIMTIIYTIIGVVVFIFVMSIVFKILKNNKPRF